jgi:hypothetical protein
LAALLAKSEPPPCLPDVAANGRGGSSPRAVESPQSLLSSGPVLSASQFLVSCSTAKVSALIPLFSLDLTLPLTAGLPADEPARRSPAQQVTSQVISCWRCPPYCRHGRRYRTRAGGFERVSLPDYILVSLYGALVFVYVHHSFSSCDQNLVFFPSRYAHVCLFLSQIPREEASDALPGKLLSNNKNILYC